MHFTNYVNKLLIKIEFIIKFILFNLEYNIIPLFIFTKKKKSFKPINEKNIQSTHLFEHLMCMINNATDKSKHIHPTTM